MFFFNGIESKRNIMKYDVLQGSILGPLLFLMYVNDLAVASKITFALLFANYTNLFVSNRDLKTLIRELNQDFQNYSIQTSCYKSLISCYLQEIYFYLCLF